MVRQAARGSGTAQSGAGGDSANSRSAVARLSGRGSHRRASGSPANCSAMPPTLVATTHRPRRHRRRRDAALARLAIGSTSASAQPAAADLVLGHPAVLHRHARQRRSASSAAHSGPLPTTRTSHVGAGPAAAAPRPAGPAPCTAAAGRTRAAAAGRLRARRRRRRPERHRRSARRSAARPAGQPLRAAAARRHAWSARPPRRRAGTAGAAACICNGNPSPGCDVGVVHQHDERHAGPPQRRRHQQVERAGMRADRHVRPQCAACAAPARAPRTAPPAARTSKPAGPP